MLSKEAEKVDEKKGFEQENKSLQAGGIGSLIGSLFGCPGVEYSIESLAGIKEGGRTGLSTLITSGLFFLSLLFIPLIKIIPKEAIAPVLIILGFFLIQRALKVDFTDITEGIPMFITLAVMPLTGTIHEAVIWGVFSYTLLKLFTGKTKDISLVMYIISGISIIYYILRPYFV